MWLVKFPLSSFKDSSEILPAMYDKNKFRNGKEKYRSKQITQLHIGPNKMSLSFESSLSLTHKEAAILFHEKNELKSTADWCEYHSDY